MAACSTVLCCAEGRAHALDDGHQAVGDRPGVMQVSCGIGSAGGVESLYELYYPDGQRRIFRAPSLGLQVRAGLSSGRRQCFSVALRRVGLQVWVNSGGGRS
jgi:hypothetical protein